MTSLLTDERTVAYWSLSEPVDSALPRDVSGHLADFAVPSGLTRPAVEHTPEQGFAREFTRTPATGLVVEDTAGDLRLTRNVGLLFIARLDLDDLDDGDILTLIQRGRRGGADPVAFGLRVVVQDVAAREVYLQLFWEDATGADIDDVGAYLTVPENAGPMLVAATREVIDGLLAVRYFVNGTHFDGQQNHPLTAAGEEAADVSLGMAMDGAAYEDHWQGSIAAAHVISEAIAPAELDWLWERMTVDQPAGVEAMRRYVPPGGVYSEDPDSQIQRELAIEGAAFGFAKSAARRMRFYDPFPDRAWGKALERWERITGNPPRPGDSIAQRQARVLDHTSSLRGADLDSFRERLAEAFDQEPGDIDLREFGVEKTISFASDPGEAIVEPGGNPDPATWTVGSGVLTVDTGTAGASPIDAIHRGRLTPAPAYLFPLPGAPDAWIEAKITSAAGDAGIAGVILGRRDRDEWVVIGLRLDGGSERDVAWVNHVGREMPVAPHVLAAEWDTVPTYLVLHIQHDGTIDVRWGTSLAAARAQAPTNIDPGFVDPTWVGFALWAEHATANPTNGLATFDDLFMHTPAGPQPLYWYAFRDLGDPGQPDMEWANRIIAAKKQAHTHAAAISTTDFICDTPSAIVDRGPLSR